MNEEKRQENNLIITKELEEELPMVVKNELSKLSPERQTMFIEEYERKKKKLIIAYLLWGLLFGSHYAYQKKWGLQVLFWLSEIFLIGIIWWVIDAFRIPGMIKNYNKDISIEILRDMKIISS